MADAPPPPEAASPHDRARARLEAELGSLPHPIAQLGGEELARLADALDSARRREAKALAEGRERALGYIPRLLRGPVRKVVG